MTQRPDHTADEQHDTSHASPLLGGPLRTYTLYRSLHARMYLILRETPRLRLTGLYPHTWCRARKATFALPNLVNYRGDLSLFVLSGRMRPRAGHSTLGQPCPCLPYQASFYLMVPHDTFAVTLYFFPSQEGRCSAGQEKGRRPRRLGAPVLNKISHVRRIFILFEFSPSHFKKKKGGGGDCLAEKPCAWRVDYACDVRSCRPQFSLAPVFFKFQALHNSI